MIRYLKKKKLFLVFHYTKIINIYNRYYNIVLLLVLAV